MSDRKPTAFPILTKNDVCSLIQAADDVYQIRFSNRAANAYLVRGSARSATAIAAVPNTRVMRINHARFVYLVSQQPDFALMVMDALSKRLGACNAVTYREAQS